MGYTVWLAGRKHPHPAELQHPVRGLANKVIEEKIMEKKTGKKKAENRHVYGVFLRIIKKGKHNSRIFMIEFSTGQFIDGKIATEAIRRVKLRHIISIDLTDIREVKDINKMVFNEKYTIQPSVYPNDVDTDLLER